MAWTFEFKAGLAWATVLTILMGITIWLEVAVQNIWPLVIPIVVYIAFTAWVFRIKK